MRALGMTNEGALERGNDDEEFLLEAVRTSLRRNGTIQE